MRLPQFWPCAAPLYAQTPYTSSQRRTVVQGGLLTLRVENLAVHHGPNGAEVRKENCAEQCKAERELVQAEPPTKRKTQGPAGARLALELKAQIRPLLSLGSRSRPETGRFPGRPTIGP